MKRAFVLFIFIIMVFTGCQSEQENNIYDNTETTPRLKISDHNDVLSKIENSKVNLEIQLENNRYSESVEKLNLIVENYGPSEIYFGSGYQMEKYKDGLWYKVPFRDNVTSTSILYKREKKQKYTQEIILSLLDYQFTQGRYRIIKSFNLNERTDTEDTMITLAAEFGIY
jgi:hypothetical protein